MKKYPISVIIPVFKNYDMFFRSLKLNKKHLEGCQVIIMNDYPQENITQKIKEIFPTARVYNNKKNLGFAGNINKGIKKATKKYVFLMNSDVVLRDDSFKESINHFKKNKKLFAVGFAQLEKNGQIVGANIGYFHKGFIHHEAGNSSTLKVSYNFWAEGGASVFRRDLIIKLGLLDETFNPFYWEDIDLSYRAWKSGYEIIFDPSILVEHHHESTIGKYFQQQMILKIAFRNQLFFHWKNLTDKDLLIAHLLNLPKQIFRPGFFDALIKLPQILKKRKKTIKLFKKTDKEILNNFHY